MNALSAWFEQCLAWGYRRRNALVAHPAFQRWASNSVWTRRIAQQHASGLFDLIAGFVYSQTLLACVQLDLFERLEQRPLTAEAVAEACGLPPEAARRLLKAAAAIELVREDAHGRFGLGRLGAPMLHNDALRAMVLHHRALYADLADPVALLREPGEGRLARFWPYAGASAAQDGDAARRYSELMSASQSLVIGEVLSAVDFSGCGCVMDVGGGDGTFACRLVRAYAQLCVRVADLPAVAALAQSRAQREGLEGRVTACAVDFRNDEPLPGGADAVSLIRVLHDHDDDDVLHLLRKVHAALPAGGLLVIAEPMAGIQASARVGDAYFGWYLLAMGSGRAREPVEIIGMLTRCGFERARLLRSHMNWHASVITAYRAKC